MFSSSRWGTWDCLDWGLDWRRNYGREGGSYCCVACVRHHAVQTALDVRGEAVDLELKLTLRLEDLIYCEDSGQVWRWGGK